MFLSRYFKTIRRFLWVLPICSFGISCTIGQMAGIVDAIHGYSQESPEEGNKNPGIGTLDYQVCRFDCNEAQKVCLDSINEDEDTSTINKQCNKEKQLCFTQCGAKVGKIEGEKWCLNNDTHTYFLCE